MKGKHRVIVSAKYLKYDFELKRNLTALYLQTKEMNLFELQNLQRQLNGYLSNWALQEFTVNGIAFSSMEQYMMYQKAVCFKDEEIAEKNISNNRCCGYKSTRTAGERL